MRRLLLLSILAIAACDAGLVPTSGASPALVIRQGQTAAGDLVAGRYRLMWNAPGCTELTVQWVSDTGKGVATIETPLPSGTTLTGLPGGQGHFVTTGDCAYELTLTPSP